MCLAWCDNRMSLRKLPIPNRLLPGDERSQTTRYVTLRGQSSRRNKFSNALTLLADLPSGFIFQIEETFLEEDER